MEKIIKSAYYEYEENPRSWRSDTALSDIHDVEMLGLLRGCFEEWTLSER